MYTGEFEKPIQVGMFKAPLERRAPAKQVRVELHYPCKAQMRKMESILPVTTLPSAGRVAAERPGKFIFSSWHIWD